MFKTSLIIVKVTMLVKKAFLNETELLYPVGKRIPGRARCNYFSGK